MRSGSATRWCGRGGNQSSYTVVEAVGPSLTSQLGRIATSSAAAICSRLCGILVGRAIGDSEELPDNIRSCHLSRVLVYHKVVLGEDLALRHPPCEARQNPIYLQRLDPSETSFRTLGVSQRSEHDTPYLCKSREWPDGGARLAAGERKRKKQQKSNHGTCIGAGPKRDAHADRVPRSLGLDRIVRDEVPLLAAVCTAVCTSV